MRALVSNFLVLAGASVVATCLGELTHSTWWPGLLVVGPTLVYVGLANAPADGAAAPASAEVKKPQ